MKGSHTAGIIASAHAWMNHKKQPTTNININEIARRSARLQGFEAVDIADYWRKKNLRREEEPPVETDIPAVATIDTGTTFEDVFDGLAFEALQILYSRQRKYGPNNISQQGMFGVFTRIADDKIARIKRAFSGKVVNGEIVLDPIPDGEADDTFEDGLFDIVNYALILLSLKRGVWGKPMREDTGEVAALAGRFPDGKPPQLQEDGSVKLSAYEKGLSGPDFLDALAGVIDEANAGEATNYSGLAEARDLQEITESHGFRGPMSIQTSPGDQ